MGINSYSFNHEFDRFKNELERVFSPVSQDKMAVIASSKTNFGRCCWNGDVNRGRFLLSQRAKEISDMAKELIQATATGNFLEYQTFSSMKPSSGLSWELKNLIGRINKNIWNLICDFFTGSSRSLKKEEEKLNALATEYDSIVADLNANLNVSLQYETSRIDEKIRGYVAHWIWFYDGGAKNVDDLKNNLNILKNSVKEVNSDYFRQAFLDKIQAAEAGPLKELLE